MKYLFPSGATSINNLYKNFRKRLCLDMLLNPHGFKNLFRACFQ